MPNRRCYKIIISYELQDMTNRQNCNINISKLFNIEASKTTKNIIL